MRRLAEYLIIIAIAAYIANLTRSGNLDFYVHPRFQTFTTIAAIFTIAVGFIGIALEVKKLKQDINLRKEYQLVIMAIVITTAIIIPPKALSSVVFSQKNASLDFILNQKQKPGFQFDTSNYTIADWLSLINQSADPAKYEGKQISVSGFVYIDEDTNPQYFNLARFVITCCAVDASPVKLIVKDNWESKYKQDDWLLVRGKLKLIDFSGRKEMIIEPEEITRIDIPDNPFIAI